MRSSIKMRIAQVSPLYESVPPQGYGGTERIVSFLVEELVELGHEVTLFASGDSVTAARLIPCCQRSLRLDPRCVDPLPHHLVMLERVFDMAGEFDVIHFHVDYLHYPSSRRSMPRQLTTLHGRLDLPDLEPLYQEFSDMPIVSISDDQRRPILQANWLATVQHGLPVNLFTPHIESKGYLAFLGRISPEKGVDMAIKIAQRTGMPLKIAAKIDKADREYFEKMIKPLFDDSLIEYIGEIGDAEKNELLGGAAALLFPIDWPEPFGLVMIEAMACGTPVIAFRRGSVPEVLTDGVTGFIVDNVEEAVEAVAKLPNLNRVRCRDFFDQRFTSARMARDYVQVYSKLLHSGSEGEGIMKRLFSAV